MKRLTNIFTGSKTPPTPPAPATPKNQDKVTCVKQTGYNTFEVVENNTAKSIDNGLANTVVPTDKRNNDATLKGDVNTNNLSVNPDNPEAVVHNGLVDSDRRLRNGVDDFGGKRRPKRRTKKSKKGGKRTSKKSRGGSKLVSSPYTGGKKSRKSRGKAKK